MKMTASKILAILALAAIGMTTACDQTESVSMTQAIGPDESGRYVVGFNTAPGVVSVVDLDLTSTGFDYDYTNLVLGDVIWDMVPNRDHSVVGLCTDSRVFFLDLASMLIVDQMSLRHNFLGFDSEGQILSGQYLPTSNSYRVKKRAFGQTSTTLVSNFDLSYGEFDEEVGPRPCACTRHQYLGDDFAVATRSGYFMVFDLASNQAMVFSQIRSYADDGTTRHIRFAPSEFDDEVIYSLKDMYGNRRLLSAEWGSGKTPWLSSEEVGWNANERFYSQTTSAGIRLISQDGIFDREGEPICVLPPADELFLIGGSAVFGYEGEMVARRYAVEDCTFYGTEPIETSKDLSYITNYVGL